ncbi:hypothetical protein SAMN05216226_106105 [Halovenus aranensis]|uniref:Uncharacterized protein n=1 Tax=Halovenus aranensis TaxID=890420 RepID=A0A1G8VAS8_9EURY|nr:hypothetical protein [Halovenus aranensis]SDJ63103.1 hypothetical protein SAMN05216226_106105 [Halovenus aranensis]
MASEELSPPDGFDKGPSNDFEQDVETIELTAGETLCGTVTGKDEGDGEFGPYVRLRINDDDRGLIDYFAKGEAKQMYFADDLAVGDDVWVGMKTETQEHNGNEYHPTICRVTE